MKRFPAWTRRRVVQMLVGNLFIGLGVALFRMAGFGTDPFSSMNLAISGGIGWTFGNWQLLMNVCLLVVVALLQRHDLGLGTVVNMVGIGYLADFFCWLFQTAAQAPDVLPLRIVYLLLALVCLPAGLAMYIEASLGMAPYDAMPFVWETYTRGKLPFAKARIVDDLTCVAVAVIACVVSHHSVWSVLGVGTVCNALLQGPLTQLFRRRFAIPKAGG